MSEPIRYELQDGVAVVHFDDGKANVFSTENSLALHEALDRAEQEAGALLLQGRPGLFSGGFDLALAAPDSGASPQDLLEMLYQGSRAALRIFDFPIPTVAAMTGHSIAMGAITACCFDLRLLADGEFKIGVNEARLPSPFPAWALVPLRYRLAPTHVGRALAHGELYGPADAVAAGFADCVVPAAEVVAIAFERAKDLAQLDSKIHAQIKRDMRRQEIDAMRQAVEDGKRGFPG